MTPVARLRADAVGKVYQQSADSAVRALRGVDLTVAPGEFLAIVGPSGCGKSTLLHLLGALDAPTTGEVLLDGTRLAGQSKTQLAALRNSRVGFVFQAFHLMPALSAYDNVALPALLGGCGRGDYDDRVRGLLDAVGLADKADRLPSHLSGGEQQRVAVARALVMAPAVLLADEPTGNLDTTTGQSILRLLAGQHAQGQTIVLVTHDLKVAGHAQRIVFMRDGLVTGETDLPDASEDTRNTIASLVQLDAGDL